jgi:hypothetical protein
MQLPLMGVCRLCSQSIAAAALLPRKKPRCAGIAGRIRISNTDVMMPPAIGAGLI